jgi:hypothetical protein
MGSGIKLSELALKFTASRAWISLSEFGFYALFLNV